MRISPLTTVPFVLLLLIAGWAAWPYLEPARAAAASRPKVPEVPSEKLTRVADAIPSRDPFELPSDPLPKPIPFALSKGASATKAKSKTAARPPNAKASPSRLDAVSDHPEGLA